ncbi:jg18011 [Pararge aegeria aegeria]|uniref:Jg18011 protein n=1 Tax=Pararge aegeria aegeria TaxID=348720 RepID=A0A8S4RQD6_9NEOP|nr:jg18011 [Pararge aegeria aegeria]
MFLSYPVVTTFGVSALLSFFVSVTILLAVVSKRGLLQPPSIKQPLVPQWKEKPLPSAPELAPLAEST